MEWATIDDLHLDVLTQILRRLDGPTLATVSCSTSRLRSLATEHEIWLHLCLSTWPSLNHPRLLHLLPSFPNSHRSFFSDSHPFPHPSRSSSTSPCPSKLISAVDLHHKGGELLFSRVVETETHTPWFLGSPFRVDALESKEPPTPPSPTAAATALSPEDLTLSWIIIDPSSRRAVNLSSRRPVSIERHWYTGDVHVRFSLVLTSGAVASAVVTCGGEEALHVREMRLTMEDMDGACLNGKESLAVMQAALEGRRKGKETAEEEAKAKGRYKEYERKKRERREKKMRREGWLDMLCMVLGVSLFFTSLACMAIR